MECTLCNKQYVGKAEKTFNIRLNNHRKDVKDQKVMLACTHFQAVGHNFDKYAKIIIIDKVVNANSAKDILCERLIQRANFWIQILKTVVPLGLNQEPSKTLEILLS